MHCDLYSYACVQKKYDFQILVQISEEDDEEEEEEEKDETRTGEIDNEGENKEVHANKRSPKSTKEKSGSKKHNQDLMFHNIAAAMAKDARVGQQDCTKAMILITLKIHITHKGDGAKEEGREYGHESLHPLQRYAAAAYARR